MKYTDPTDVKSLAQFKDWLQQSLANMHESDGWRDFPEEAAGWGGSTIVEAGMLCARFGLPALFEASRALTGYDRQTGATLAHPATAISFLAKCVAAARDISDHDDAGNLNLTDHVPVSRSPKSGSRDERLKLARRFKVALIQRNEAVAALGDGITRREAFNWLERKYSLRNYERWSRYVRGGEQFYSQNPPVRESA